MKGRRKGILLPFDTLLRSRLVSNSLTVSFQLGCIRSRIQWWNKKLQLYWTLLQDAVTWIPSKQVILSPTWLYIHRYFIGRHSFFIFSISANPFFPLLRSQLEHVRSLGWPCSRWQLSTEPHSSYHGDHRKQCSKRPGEVHWSVGFGKKVWKIKFAAIFTLFQVVNARGVEVWKKEKCNALPNRKRRWGVSDIEIAMLVKCALAHGTWGAFEQRIWDLKQFWYFDRVSWRTMVNWIKLCRALTTVR